MQTGITYYCTVFTKFTNNLFVAKKINFDESFMPKNILPEYCLFPVFVRC